MHMSDDQYAQVKAAPMRMKHAQSESDQLIAELQKIIGIMTRAASAGRIDQPVEGDHRHASGNDCGEGPNH
jgi:hypothetical protein